MTSPTSTPDEAFLFSAPAVVEWLDCDGNVQRLGCSSYRFDVEVHIDAKNLGAVLRFRVMLPLKGSPNQKYVYLVINPKYIINVQLYGDEIPQVALEACAKHGGCSSSDGLVGLRFVLERPALIVGPSGNLQPKTASSGRTLDSLHSFARATAFTSYIPHRGILRDSLPALYNLNDGRFHLPAGALESLYGGKGGTRIETRGLNAESPPSYDELALPPPPRTHASSSLRDGPPTKRKRADSSPTKYPNDWRVALEMLEKRWEWRLEERLAENAKTIVDKIEERLDARMEDLRTELMDEMHEQHEQTTGEADELIEMRLDERLIDLKEEVRETVKEEMQVVEENIRANLRHALE